MEKKEKKIQCNISSLNEGLKRIENVDCIKLKSQDHNLLIMVDFQSTFGEIKKGSIEVLSNNTSYKLENLDAFYLLKDNVFSLLLKEE